MTTAKKQIEPGRTTNHSAITRLLEEAVMNAKLMEKRELPACLLRFPSAELIRAFAIVPDTDDDGWEEI